MISIKFGNDDSNSNSYSTEFHKDPLITEKEKELKRLATLGIIGLFILFALISYLAKIDFFHLLLIGATICLSAVLIYLLSKIIKTLRDNAVNVATFSNAYDFLAKYKDNLTINFCDSNSSQSYEEHHVRFNDMRIRRQKNNEITVLIDVEKR